jgi:Glycosyl hydrolase family 76
MRLTRVALIVALMLVPVCSEAGANPRDPAGRHFLLLAERGVHQSAAWWDARRRWYRERLHASGKYPLVTLWGVVPQFEALAAVAIAHPSRANRAALRRFARGAERYWNPALRPVPGYAAYPGERHRAARTWFDDNGWWGLAFLDAYRARPNRRYLDDARRAFRFIERAGWDRRRGGIWWNTDHTFKAGESLASGTLLAARLYGLTRRPSYLRAARRYIAWGQLHMWNAVDSLYTRSDRDSLTLPYVQSPMIAADRAICRATGSRAWCARAEQLAERALVRFTTTVDMGPQFDAVYLRWMLALYAEDHDPRWYWLARANAERAERNACDKRPRCTRAWNGSSVILQAAPGMLQTHAATISVFAWLATVRPAPPLTSAALRTPPPSGKPPSPLPLRSVRACSGGISPVCH